MTGKHQDIRRLTLQLDSFTGQRFRVPFDFATHWQIDDDYLRNVTVR